MNSTSIVEHKPLLEVEDFRGNFYYTELTREQLEKLMDENERIYFPFSQRGVRVSHIVSYGPADPEKVIFAWEIQQLTESEKRRVKASEKMFMEYWGGTKEVTLGVLRKWIELAKEGKFQSYQK